MENSIEITTENEKTSVQKKTYEKPCMNEHEPLEESTAYIYYTSVW